MEEAEPAHSSYPYFNRYLTHMMTKPPTKEFKFAVCLTILGNLKIVVIWIFIFIFFKGEQSKYFDIADIYWV